MTEEDIFLDVIPIYEDEMYPTANGIFHFRYTKLGCETREEILKIMYEEIKRKLCDCKVLIVVEKGMVIKVL